jgi:CRISPR/Cas system-associated exonuclease Cas4 (RecB family)
LGSGCATYVDWAPGYAYPAYAHGYAVHSYPAYACDEGILYFAESRERVPVVLDEELVAREKRDFSARRAAVRAAEVRLR